jgi:hypothetical protein
VPLHRQGPETRPAGGGRGAAAAAGRGQAYDQPLPPGHRAWLRGPAPPPASAGNGDADRRDRGAHGRPPQADGAGAGVSRPAARLGGRLPPPPGVPPPRPQALEHRGGVGPREADRPEHRPPPGPGAARGRNLVLHGAGASARRPGAGGGRRVGDRRGCLGGRPRQDAVRGRVGRVPAARAPSPATAASSRTPGRGLHSPNCGPHSSRWRARAGRPPNPCEGAPRRAPLPRVGTVAGPPAGRNQPSLPPPSSDPPPP